MAVLTQVRDHLAANLGGRKIVVAGGPVAGLTPLGKTLLELGADSVFLLGSSHGSGELPDSSELPWHSFDLRAATINESVSQYEALLATPPSAVQRRVDEFDPDHRAIALAPIVLSALPQICGRPRFGARPVAWANLEDKTQVDELWEAAGIARAESQVVALEPTLLHRAHQRMNGGDGSVWAGDARDGVHGGAERLAWVRDDGDIARAAARLSAHCDRVRVMPFIEGVPCSIHGLVAPGGVAVFRPVEMLVFRRPGEGRFVYAGASTYFDPSEQDRRAMRDAARRVGRELARRVGYRGTFSLDGVLGRDGFLPTEINARVGAGLGLLTAGLQALSLPLLSLVLAQGTEPDLDVQGLEGLVVDVADKTRAGGAWLGLSFVMAETRHLGIRKTAAGYAICAAEEPGDFDVMLGPSDLGGFLRVAPRAGVASPGAPLSRISLPALSVIDRELGLGANFHELQAPQSVR